MHTWVQLTIDGEEVKLEVDTEQDQRRTLSEALDLVIERSELDEVAVKRIEIDVTGSGAVIYRVYPRDGSESERGTVID
jgi:hypothetical protein